MTIAANRLSLSRRVVRAMESLKAMLWKRLFRSSINESFRPAATNRFLWLETLAGLIGIGSQDIHRGGVLRVSAKERAKRAALRAYRRRFLMAEQLEVRALMATITATYGSYDTNGNNGSLTITLPNDASNPLTTKVKQTYVNNTSSNLFEFDFSGVTETVTITTKNQPFSQGGWKGVAELVVGFERKLGCLFLSIVPTRLPIFHEGSCDTIARSSARFHGCRS